MDQSQWYDMATHEMPVPAATIADIENEGDPRKSLKVQVKRWCFKLYNLHDPKDVAAYEKLRLKLYDKIARKRAQMVRESVTVLASGPQQRMYQLLEWVEYDFKVQIAETAAQIGVVEVKNVQNTDKAST